MFCEKCGTDNRDNATVCSRCGEKMPATSLCGGFGDILSYEEKIPPASSAPSTVQPVSPENFTDEIRKLKTENANLKNKVRSLSRWSLISLGVSCVSVIFAVLVIFNAPKTGNPTPGISEDSPQISSEGIENVSVFSIASSDE